MSNCMGYHIGLNCDFCDKQFEFDSWWLIDTCERPDLLTKVKDGTLHDAVCPGCGHANRIQSNLLLYRPMNDPVLIFSTAEVAKLGDNKSSLRYYLNVLKKKLGNNWRDEWMAKGVVKVQRSQLASLIRKGDDAIKNWVLNYMKLLELVQTLICAEQWDGTRAFLLKNPILLDKPIQQLFDEIISRLDAEGNMQSMAMFDEYKKLLQRCCEIGVEGAINEKRTSPGKPT
jgi:hypothetical protein